MGKDKLRKFAENLTFKCMVQPEFDDIFHKDHPLKGRWHEDFFHNNNPIVLELGCGKGEYAVGLARQYPNKNFIGIDIKGARMWTGATESMREGMTNVAFLRTNIEMLSHFFAENEVDEIWITFPDPQMKKATKRLTSTFFMARYRQLLRPDGLIHLKSDSPFLYTYTQVMVKENHYSILVDTDDLYSEEAVRTLGDKANEARMLQTHYENQWLDRGLTIKYIVWQLPEMPSLIEPEIEIEKDTYRSYGRNYVSSTNN